MGELDDPVIVEFPLRGEWVVERTPAHRIPSHGTDLFGQRYAYDLVRTDHRPGFHLHPAGTLRWLLIGGRTRDCYGWGQPVHAAFEGDVVEAVDGVEERQWIDPCRAGVVGRAEEPGGLQPLAPGTRLFPPRRKPRDRAGWADVRPLRPPRAWERRCYQREPRPGGRRGWTCRAHRELHRAAPSLPARGFGKSCSGKRHPMRLRCIHGAPRGSVGACGVRHPRPAGAHPLGLVAVPLSPPEHLDDVVVGIEALICCRRSPSPLLP
jgi:hypothetical protein